ncbi:MAG: helicase-related protein, partial [Candidatus Saccharimonadales bacterium]
AFMAPTELLARQHLLTITELLKPLGLDDRLVMLTGSLKAVSKRAAINKANKTSGAFVVGTHSLLTSGVDWSNLALLIIDEQHRFGVDQRMSLQKQAGRLPHFLSITATPIPRSLALTIFNDLDISRLRQMPSGRQPIVSKLIAPGERTRLWQSLKSELSSGRQLYVVCPYIHTSEWKDNIALESIFPEFQKRFKEYRAEFIHSQLSAEEQAKVMADFASSKIKILVATTIIEAGVDVANASVMVIYGPERFGLAQLHQLRGRVGRGEYQSYCFLMLSDSLSPPERLRSFVNIDDGFELSELDLSIRGPGAIYGKLQHGKGLGSLLTLDDHQLISLVKSAVSEFLSRHEPLSKYPELAKEVDAARQMTYLN